MKRRILPLIAVLLLTGLIFGACGAGGGRAPMDAASGSSGGSMNQGKASAAPGSGGAGEGMISANAPVQLDRKIILNAQVDMRVQDADPAVTRIREAVNSSGGYIYESRTEGTRQQGRRVTLVMRVPSGSYPSIMELLGSMGEKTNEREWTNDVTEEFLDLEARISTKERHVAQLQALYERSGSVREMMELEQEIARVTGELESMKGRIQYLSNQVAFSTITVGLYEPGTPAPIRPPETVWERMKLGFTSSFNAVVNFVGNLAVLLVSLIPVVGLLLVMGGIGYGIFRLIPRRERPKAKPPSPPPPPPPSPDDQK